MIRPAHRFLPVHPGIRTGAWRAGLAATALAAGVLLAGAAVARPGQHGPGKGRLGSVERLEHGLERLGLDEPTLQSAHAVLDAARESGRESRAHLREAHEALRALLEQEAPDPDAVMAQAEVIGALRTEVRKRQLATLLEVQALLTPEQRAQLRGMARHGGPGRRGGCGER